MDITKRKRQKSNAHWNENTMDNLPEHLIGSILERLPIQDAVRTSILSKKWRYKWTTMRSVVFDDQISKKWARYGPYNTRGFIRIINQVLLFHEGSIDKFSLDIPNMQLDSFQEVDRWILYLSRGSTIKDLTIANSNQRYQLPLCMFSCLQLRKLELSNCIFKPPLQFQGFLYLETLTLNNIDFTTNLGGFVLNVPELKNLTMQSCTNLYNLFKLKATKLQNLCVMNCHDVMLLELLHSQDLDFVSITHDKPIKDIIRLERVILALMFTKMPKVEKFYIDGNFLKVFIAEQPKWFPWTVNTLKHLRLNDFSVDDVDHLPVVLCLLQNSPNLETLRMTNIRMESQSTNNGVETISCLLESADCLDQTFNRLKTVELSPIQVSSLQLRLIKLLLAHSPSLEKFSIRPLASLDVYKRYNIAKDVMRLPRASPKAEMDFLDPK